LTVLPPDRRGLQHHSSKGTTMTQPHPEAHAAPPGGYEPPAAPPYQGGVDSTGSQPPRPYAGPQQGYATEPQPPQPYAGPQGAYPAGPQLQQPFAAPQQPYQQPQYQSHTPGSQEPDPGLPQYQAYPPAPQQPQYQQQPPMPNPAYGYPQPKSKVVAGLFGLFLGGLGIHRFYLGFTKVAVIQLVLTLVVSIFTLGLGLLFVGLWGFIEGIMILAGSAHFQRDAHGIPLRD
jgi:TM2 domain-containing membrane protein YozV